MIRYGDTNFWSSIACRKWWKKRSQEFIRTRDCNWYPGVRVITPDGFADWPSNHGIEVKR